MDTVGDACGDFYCTSNNSVFAGVTTWGTGVRVEKGIASFVEAMVSSAEEAGAEFRYQTPACKLASDDSGMPSQESLPRHPTATFSSPHRKASCSPRRLRVQLGHHEQNHPPPRFSCLCLDQSDADQHWATAILWGLEAGSAEDDYPLSS